MFNKHYRLFNEAAEGGDPGAGAAPTSAATAPAAQPSALSSAAPSPADAWPEKFRTMGEDGVFDLTATATKVLEGYSALEKRLGTGDLPPRSAEEYTLDLADFESMKQEENMQNFLKGAHAVGMTNKQVQHAMTTMAEFITREGFVKGHSAASCDAELSKVWADDAAFSAGKQAAYKSAEALAAKAGMSIHDIEASGLGNNPVFIRLAAALGNEIGEDKGVTPAVSATETETIESLMASEAYLNPQHAGHKEAAKKVRAYHEKKFGTAPAL